jgi:hypothetical protein
VLSEPDLSFGHAGLKIKWAEQHIVNLNSIRNSVIEKHPRTVSLEANPNGSWSLVVRPTEPLPPAIPLLAGDAVHNLRAALDYCWMGLWRSIDPDAKKDTLPRGKLRDDVERRLRQVQMEDAIQGIDSFILDRIKPYEDGGNLLWLAGQLDNWDKHNLLIMTLGATMIRRMSIKGTLLDHIQVVAGKPLSFISFGATPDDSIQFDYEPDVAVDLVISHGETICERPLVPLLVGILKGTAEAVELFRATFGAATGEPVPTREGRV